MEATRCRSPLAPRLSEAAVLTLPPPPPHIPGQPRSLSREATSLLAESAQDAWGEVSVSEYETGRLVELAPWLDGHPARLSFLLDRQHADGSWGAPDGYALVPTLSAVHALLAADVTRRDDAVRLRSAVGSGLVCLERLLDRPAGHLPDTIAVELVVPALVEDINRRLPCLPGGTGDGPRQLRHPRGVDPRPLRALRAEAASGAPLGMKAWHTWETLNAPRPATAGVRLAHGGLSASPAATAAWLGAGPTTPAVRQARAYLQEVQRRHGGPVPSTTSITFFERAWLLCSFDSAGVDCLVPGALLDSLETALTAEGAPAGEGLPPDADDTAAVLLALAAHGRGRRPEALMDYRTDGHFLCFSGERTPSTSTNAHVLECLARHVADRPEDGGRYGSALRTAAQWLLDAQHRDGYWLDKWHASPYYATLCCVQALAVAEAPAPALRRAARWVTGTQRADGGWGLWHSTAEETAYALLILAQDTEDPSSRAATLRGRAFLLHACASGPPRTSLWHDKDLYMPVRVVRGACVAALHATYTGKETAS